MFLLCISLVGLGNAIVHSAANQLPAHPLAEWICSDLWSCLLCFYIWLLEREARKGRLR
jgi:hypothetical protein